MPDALGERLRDEEHGATAVEYGVLIAGILLAMILTVLAIGRSTNDGFTDTCQGLDSISTAPNGCPTSS